MDPVKLAAMLAGLAMAQPAAAGPVANWHPFVVEASLRFGVPADWIERVMRAESGGYTTIDGRPIRSRKGAIGLMQLMPATWAAMRSGYSLGFDPDDPHDNILAGTAYLRLMYERFGYPGMFGAYNTGPGRYAAWLAGRQQLPGETIAYLEGVAGPGKTAPIKADAPPRDLLFALRHDLAATRPPPADAPAESALFVVRKGP
jgi:soluble lytic murein transglycosylase-like protein